MMSGNVYNRDIAESQQIWIRGQTVMVKTVSKMAGLMFSGFSTYKM